MIERIPITDRASWLDLRGGFLTASDLGAARGIDPYKTPLGLYNEKLGLVPPQQDNQMMKRGRMFEHAAVAGLRDDLEGWTVAQPGIFLADRAHRLGATPDCILTDPDGRTVNCQIKTVARFVYEKNWAGGPPLHYALQTVCEGMLMDADSNIVCALVPETGMLHLHDLPRHPHSEAEILKIAAEFWRRIDERDPPPPNYSRDADQLAAMFPKSVSVPVLDLSDDNRLAELLPQRALLKDQIAVHEELVKAIDTEIKDKMREAEVAILPGWKITWKTQTNPERLQPEVTFRQLRIHQSKDNSQ